MVRPSVNKSSGFFGIVGESSRWVCFIDPHFIETDVCARFQKEIYSSKEERDGDIMGDSKDFVVEFDRMPSFGQMFEQFFGRGMVVAC